MKQINIASDIIPIADFKIHVSKYLNDMKHTRRPMVITQNGKPAGVVLTPEDYDELIYQQSLLESVKRGISDVEKGDVYTTEELRAELLKKRNRNGDNLDT